MASAANEYVVRAPALYDTHGAPEGWGSLPAELQEEILQHVCVEVSQRQLVFQTRPADMAKSMAKCPLMAGARNPLLFPVYQEYVISRAMATPFRWGRVLTIKLSESVDRTRLNPAMSAVDVARLCARVDRTETWSGVSRIRLR